MSALICCTPEFLPKSQEQDSCDTMVFSFMPSAGMRISFAAAAAGMGRTKPVACDEPGTMKRVRSVGDLPRPKPPPPPIRVAIVGGGLTGCLTACLLRRKLNDEQTAASANHGTDPRPVEITVFERSSYPSGRFGAGIARSAYMGKNTSARWNDLGSQVLSVVNAAAPDSDGAATLAAHPRAGTENLVDGHGCRASDVVAAWKFAGGRLWQREGLLTPAALPLALPEVTGQKADAIPSSRSWSDWDFDFEDPKWHCGVTVATEERMHFNGLWQHFWPTRGLGCVLWWCLLNAIDGRENSQGEDVSGEPEPGSEVLDDDGNEIDDPFAAKNDEKDLPDLRDASVKTEFGARVDRMDVCVSEAGATTRTRLRVAQKEKRPAEPSKKEHADAAVPEQRPEAVRTEDFDVVVLTVPAPEAAALLDGDTKTVSRTRSTGVALEQQGHDVDESEADTMRRIGEFVEPDFLFYLNQVAYDQRLVSSLVLLPKNVGRPSGVPVLWDRVAKVFDIRQRPVFNTVFKRGDQTELGNATGPQTPFSCIGERTLDDADDLAALERAVGAGGDEFGVPDLSTAAPADLRARTPASAHDDEGRRTSRRAFDDVVQAYTGVRQWASGLTAAYSGTRAAEPVRIHLIALQNQKGPPGVLEKVQPGDAVGLTIHSQALGRDVLNARSADDLKTEFEALCASCCNWLFGGGTAFDLIMQKTIFWGGRRQDEVSQMSRPIGTVIPGASYDSSISEDPVLASFGDSCYVLPAFRDGDSGKSRKPTPGATAPPPCVILAGDYFTQSNFLGCFCSASAAARAAARRISGLDRS